MFITLLEKHYELNSPHTKDQSTWTSQSVPVLQRFSEVPIANTYVRTYYASKECTLETCSFSTEMASELAKLTKPSCY